MPPLGVLAEVPVVAGQAVAKGVQVTATAAEATMTAAGAATGAAEAVGGGVEATAGAAVESTGALASLETGSIASPEDGLSLENSQLEGAIASEEGYLDAFDAPLSIDEVDPGITEFLSAQDPESMMSQLSGMSESDLDAVIAEIGNGDLDAVKGQFEGGAEALPEDLVMPEIDRGVDTARFDYLKSIIEMPDLDFDVELETGVDAGEVVEAPLETPELAPDQTVVEVPVEPQPEIAPVETDPGDVDDPDTFVVAGPSVSPNQGVETVEEVEGVEEEPLVPEAIRERQEGDVQKETELVEAEGSPQEMVQPRVESMVDFKYGGTVIYDLEDSEPLADMRVALAYDPSLELWTLPEVPLEGRKTEERETEQKIEEHTRLELDMQKELERRSDKVTSSDGSTGDMESTYFLAQSDSETPVKEGVNIKWFTLGELADLEIPLYEHVMPLINKGLDAIQKKRERAKNSPFAPLGL